MTNQKSGLIIFKFGMRPCACGCGTMIVRGTATYRQVTHRRKYWVPEHYKDGNGEPICSKSEIERIRASESELRESLQNLARSMVRT